MASRRHVLALLTATPFAACTPSNMPDPAAGWRDPGAGEADPRRFALAHAILAPNPHNTQPWQVAFERDDAMTLWCDLERRLPFTDPLDRQITLGCGAFLELFRLAALSLGFAAEITPFPEGEPAPTLDARPLAHVKLTAREQQPLRNPLFEQITARRTNRNIYDAEAIPSDAALARVASATGAFVGAALWTVQPARVAALRDLVWRAFDREMRTQGAQAETYRWLRFGAAERARYRDGLFIDVPVPGLLRAVGMLDEADLTDPESSANRQAAADWRRKAESAPAFMWLTTPSDTPAARLQTGMAYARLNLAATDAGLAMHPWSQALQEYEAMADLYAEAKAMLTTDDAETIQMLVRVGRAAPVEPAARRAAVDFVRS
ncbi:MAG: nitroreductase family protein [Hyphomonadaceae bacterium]